jgi:hypothetical protein
VSLSYDDPYLLVRRVGKAEDSLARQVVADPVAAGDDELRRAHSHLLEVAWRWHGIERLRILYGPLRHVDEELRRRGQTTLRWTREISARSSAGERPWLN